MKTAVVILVVTLAGCATANPMGHEGPAARMHREAFTTCQNETGIRDAKIRWMAPDGVFDLWAPDRESLTTMQRCMSEVAGTTWLSR